MMRTIALAAAVLAIVMLLAWWALRGADESSPDVDAPAAPRTTVPAIGATPADRAVPSRRPHSGAAAADASPDDAVASYSVPEPFGISVRVLRADGSPAAGAIVTTVVGVRSAVNPTEKTTDAEGRASFDDLDLSGSSALLANWQGREAVIVPRPDHPGEVEMRLGTATTIQGRVETTRGEPVEGALCELRWPEAAGIEWSDTLVKTESEADGRFSFPTLPDAPSGAIPTVLASLRLQGWDRDERPVQGGAVVLRLRPPRAALGRCVDTARRPIAGVRVFVDQAQDFASGPDGRFEVANLPEDGEAPLQLTPRAHVPRLVAIPAGRDDVDLGDVTFADGVTLAGVVVGSDGRPLPGVSVAATGRGPAEWDRAARTGPDGRFSIEHLPADETVGVVAWLIESSGHAPTDWRAADGELRIVFPVERLLRLRFVGEDGVTAVEVRSCTVSAFRWSRPAEASAPSAELVVAPGWCDGITLRVVVPGWEPVVLPSVTVTDDAPTTIDVRLTTPAKPRTPKPRPGR